MDDSSQSRTKSGRKTGRTLVYVLVAGILLAIAVILVLRPNAAGRPDNSVGRDKTPATSAPKQ